MTTSNVLRALGAVLLLAPVPAFAAGPATAGTPQPTVLTLSVTGTANHAPDAMTAVLEAVGQATDAAKAQAIVNRMMTATLHDVDGIKGLTARTGGYSVGPADPKQTAWIARQSVTLHFDAAPDAGDAAAVRKMIGRLQQSGMQLETLEGTLSPKTATGTRNRAIVDATRRLRSEAQTMADALGETVGPIRTVTLGNQAIRPVFGGMALAARAAAPAARSGPIEERVNLSATIELRPKTP